MADKYKAKYKEAKKRIKELEDELAALKAKKPAAKKTTPRATTTAKKKVAKKTTTTRARKAKI